MSSRPAYLHHITIDTGHTRRSPRSEVSDDVLPAVRQLLTSALQHDVPILGAPAYSLRATAEGDALLVTVSHREDGPLVSFGVARSEGVSALLWAMMLSIAAPTPLGTRELDRPLPAPWLAVRLYPALALHADAADWLGDLERCIAWVWIDLP